MGRKLSTIEYHPMVTGISRKFATGNQKCTETLIGRGNTTIKIPGTPYMGAQVRHATLNGIGEVQKNVMFFRKAIKNLPKTNDQRNATQTLQRSAEWVNAALKDLQAVQANAAKYRQAREDFSKTINEISAKGYQTMRGWMVAVIYAGIYNDGDWNGSVPQDHNLPAFDA